MVEGSRPTSGRLIAPCAFRARIRSRVCCCSSRRDHLFAPFNVRVWSMAARPEKHNQQAMQPNTLSIMLGQAFRARPIYMHYQQPPFLHPCAPLLRRTMHSHQLVKHFNRWEEGTGAGQQCGRTIPPPKKNTKGTEWENTSCNASNRHNVTEAVSAIPHPFDSLEGCSKDTALDTAAPKTLQSCNPCRTNLS